MKFLRSVKGCTTSDKIKNVIVVYSGMCDNCINIGELSTLRTVYSAVFRHMYFSNNLLLSVSSNYYTVTEHNVMFLLYIKCSMEIKFSMKVMKIRYYILAV